MNIKKSIREHLERRQNTKITLKYISLIKNFKTSQKKNNETHFEEKRTLK